MFTPSPIPSRAPYCSAGREPFEKGVNFVSFLEIEEEKCHRLDFCLECWEKIKKEKIPQGLHWHGRIVPKKEKRVSHDAQALALLKKYYDAANDKKTLYLLALYLERRKQLVLRGVMKGAQVFESVVEEEVFKVEKISLTFEDINALLPQLLDALACS